MTPETVRKRVERIDAMAGDDESAHGAEDGLWLSVLKAIANGHPESAALAAEAIKTEQIEFARWRA